MRGEGYLGPWCCLPDTVGVNRRIHARRGLSRPVVLSPDICTVMLAEFIFGKETESHVSKCSCGRRGLTRECFARTIARSRIQQTSFNAGTMSLIQHEIHRAADCKE